MMYTIKQLAQLAGISVRTLHYYDEIGLLKPTSVGANGYRYYAEADLFQLQQILFFRELDLGLEQIKQIIVAPDFDLVVALQTHRHALEEKISRGYTYEHDPEFHAFFAALDPDLPAFIAQAVAVYVDALSLHRPNGTGRDNGATA